MKAIINTTASSLEWRDLEVGNHLYELWAGEDLLATLAFGSPSRTLATVETVEGSWVFQQAGFLLPSIRVRELDSDLDLAVFHHGFLGHGHLRFTNGVTFHWRHEGSGSATWSFRGDGGEVLITLQLEPATETGSGPHRIQAEVKVTPAGHFSPRVPLLAALGWYLILLQQQEQAADAGLMEHVF